MLSSFHAENHKQAASAILELRNKRSSNLIKVKKAKPNEKLDHLRFPESDVTNNQFRNFIRSCIIGGHVKCSARQTYALIAGGALADGPSYPIYGYNNRSESAIVAVQVFAAFILRAKLMSLIRDARVIALFSDAESARYDKLLMYGVHLVLNGYCCPLPLCFGLGGVSVTADLLRQTLIDGVTARNIISGGSQVIPEIA